jgi:hypothetical protein
LSQKCIVVNGAGGFLFEKLKGSTLQGWDTVYRPEIPVAGRV